MKKKTGTGIALAALLAVCAACALTAAFGRKAEPLRAIAFSGGRDTLQAELTYDAGLRTLRGTQTMTLVNRTGAAQQEIVLRVSMNGADPQSVSVGGVTVDGQPAASRLDAEDPTVLRIAMDWPEGAEATLRFSLVIRHAPADGAAIVTLPALALYENGAWRTQAYDALAGPGCAQAFDFCVTVDGEIVHQLCGARDASFALCPEGVLREKMCGGVRVRAAARSASQAGRLLLAAQEALRSLREAGFDYPFDMLLIAAGDAGREDGEAYSGLIALDADGDGEALRRRITRLIARQTFGILVGCDMEQSPWLSVSLASAAELLAYRARKGEAAYQTRFFEEIEISTRLTRPYGVTVGASVEHFGGDAEMTQVLRDQGAAMLLGIGQAAGEEALVQALNLYARENAGRIAGQAELERALLEATGSAWDGYLRDGLSW